MIVQIKRAILAKFVENGSGGIGLGVLIPPEPRTGSKGHFSPDTRTAPSPESLTWMA